MSSITVTGGVDGISARMDDLSTMAALLQQTVGTLDDALDELGAPMLHWHLATDDGHDPLGASALHDEVVAVAGPYGPLPLVRDRLSELAHQLRTAVAMYQHADHTVLDSILGGLGHLLAGGLFAAGGDYQRAGSQYFASLPGLTDLTMSFTGGLDAAVAAAPDGHAVLHDLGPDDRSTVAPRSLTDLIAGVALRNEGRHGEISVSFVVGADGTRRAIVDIPGTKSWNPVPNHDVTSVGTDLRAMAGKRTAYEDGIFEALTAAGVGADEPVLLVGHSEGGIVAIDAARDAVRSGQFRITHVVTAGSPIGRIARDLPDSVQVLALENSADIVPHCDAAENPDRRNVTTVTGEEQQLDILANHDLTDSYEPLASAADHSDSGSIRAFAQSAHGFLGSTTMSTHTYWITRGF